MLYYTKDPKRDDNFDNHPLLVTATVRARTYFKEEVVDTLPTIAGHEALEFRITAHARVDYARGFAFLMMAKRTQIRVY